MKPQLIPIDGGAPDLHDALAAEGLPTSDLTEPGRRFFRVVQGGATVGFAGYELFGEDALLRSIVIMPHDKGKGLGAAALELLIEQVMKEGARRGYLLTTSAAPYFERLGFTPIGRSAAPEAVSSSRQAASLCPASATLLTRQFSV